MPLCPRRAWTTIRGPVDPSRLTTYPPQGCYDGIVPPRCDLHTLTNVIFRTNGWPNGRGDRLAYSSWRSTGGCDDDHDLHHDGDGRRNHPDEQHQQARQLGPAGAEAACGQHDL